MVCGNDPVFGAGVCLFSCTNTEDCPDPQTHCIGGQCVTNLCAADGGPIDGPCNAAGTGDGICGAELNPTANVPIPIGVCQQTGSLAAGATCTQGTPRDAGAAGLCTQGTNCEYQLDGGALTLCLKVCDVTATSVCGAGAVCLPNPYDTDDAQDGICSQLSADAGCALGVDPYATELDLCTSIADCACSTTCVSDTGSGKKYCERPCKTPADCDIPYSTCLGGTCAYNYCQQNQLGATVPGTYEGPCTVWDAGDGTCQAQVTENYGVPTGTSFGLCQLDGTANLQSQSCTQYLSAPASNLCGSDEQCIGDPIDGYACYALCLPETFDGGSCGAGNGCFAYYPDDGLATVAPNYGYCAECSDPGDPCAANSECCSLMCSGGSCM
jgi:hypothetical protein